MPASNEGRHRRFSLHICHAEGGRPSGGDVAGGGDPARERLNAGLGGREVGDELRRCVNGDGGWETSRARRQLLRDVLLFEIPSTFLTPIHGQRIAISQRQPGRTGGHSEAKGNVLAGQFPILAMVSGEGIS